jgi:hypothetical protein
MSMTDTIIRLVKFYNFFVHYEMRVVAVLLLIFTRKARVKVSFPSEMKYITSQIRLSMKNTQYIVPPAK